MVAVSCHVSCVPQAARRTCNRCCARCTATWTWRTRSAHTRTRTCAANRPPHDKHIRQHVTATATVSNSTPYARTAAQPDAVVHNIAQLSCTECGLPREPRRDVGSKDRLQNNSHTTVALLRAAAACCLLLAAAVWHSIGYPKGQKESPLCGKRCKKQTKTKEEQDCA